MDMDTGHQSPLSPEGESSSSYKETPEAEAITTIEPEGPEEKSAARQQPGGTPLQESLRRLRKDKRAMVSLFVILLFVILPLVGPPIYQHIGVPYNSDTYGIIGPEVYHNPAHQELSRQDEGPSAQYWLGTDAVGRDMFARLTQGMLISLVVAVMVEIVTVVLGLTIGILAGYFGGWIDQLLARFTDIIFAFPGLLFAILLTGIFGSYADGFFNKVPFIGGSGQARLLLVSLALATVGWPLMARFARGQTLQLKQQQFVEAARTAGTSHLMIILRHILPNMLSIILVASTLDISNTIVGEASLSYLGLGVQPPGSSIGLMISGARSQLASYPWEVLLPIIILTMIVLAFSFLGDGLRDAFDPRTKD